MGDGSRTGFSDKLLLGGTTGRDHFFRASGGGTARVSLCGIIIGVSADVGIGCWGGRDQTLGLGT